MFVTATWEIMPLSVLGLQVLVSQIQYDVELAMPRLD